jgi:hypothetical protein
MITETSLVNLDNKPLKVNKKKPPQSNNSDLPPLFFTSLFIGAKGTGKSYSFQQVADLISSKQELIPIPEEVKYSYQELTCSDNTKLESVLGSQKWITIEEFLKTRNNR